MVTQTQKQLEAFGAHITVEGYNLGSPFGSEEKGCVGARIELGDDRPERVNLTLWAKDQDNTSPFVVHEEEPYEYPGDLEFPFSSSVAWIQEKGVWTPSVPNFRESEESFANLLFLNPDAHVLDTQWCVSANGNDLYLFGQKVYAGWMRILKGMMEFIPSEKTFARPGMDYQGQWQERGKILEFLGNLSSRVAVRGGGRLSEVQPAEWEYPETSSPIPNGWVLAVVTHYNPITWSGLAIGANGTLYQLFANNLQDFGGPVQLPGHGDLVIVAPRPSKPGFDRTLVTACRPYIPGESPSVPETRLQGSKGPFQGQQRRDRRSGHQGSRRP